MVIGRVVMAAVLLYAAIERQQGWAQWAIGVAVLAGLEILSVILIVTRRDLARVTPIVTDAGLSNDTLRELLDLAESTSTRDWTRQGTNIVKMFDQRGVVVASKSPTMSHGDFEFIAACSPRVVATMARTILKARGVEV